MKHQVRLNKWLNTTVEAYINNFGMTATPVVYEVGSRDGNDGVELASRIYNGNNLWRDAHIVLFECNPPQQEIIRASYPNATLIPQAISDKKGTVEFLQLHGDKNVVGSSSMDLNRAKVSWARDNTRITVKTRRLDDVIESLNHQKTTIDIMKIDIEGYTAEALRSLGKYLGNVRVFHLETEIEGVARAETNLDIAYFMQTRGYVCVSLEHEWGDNIQDQVYVKEERDV